MSIFYHNNFKKRLAYEVGAINGISTNGKSFKNANDGSGLSVSPTTVKVPSYLNLTTPSTSCSSGNFYAFLSSSDIELSEEYTCPDLISTISNTNDSGITDFSINGTVTHTYNVTNNGNSNITIRKVAVYACADSASLSSRPDYFYMLYVINLDTPLTLTPNETGVISFSIDFSKL